MKYLFKCYICIVLVFLDSLLDEYYNICRNCGRVISSNNNTCPYCSDIQRKKSEGMRKDL